MVPIQTLASSAEVRNATFKSRVLLNFLALASPEIQGSDSRSIIFLCFRSLVMEHADSIVALCESGRYGSAMAMFRPLIETISRGEWLYFCATPDELERFAKHEKLFEDKRFKNVAREVDERLAYDPHVNPDFALNRLSMFNDFYDKMCDYTHTGHDAISRRLTETETVEPNYPDFQVTSLLLQSVVAVAHHSAMTAMQRGEDSTVEVIARAVVKLYPELSTASEEETHN